MLAYAAHRRTVAGRRPAPHALLVIIVAHIAAIAAVMSARMDAERRPPDPPIIMEPIPIPEPPPPEPQPQADPRQSETPLAQVPPRVPIALPVDEPVHTSPVSADPGPVIGPAVVPQPRLDPMPIIEPVVRIGPRFATPPSAVRPPYPMTKIASGEEASLKLKLSINEQGRVIAVEPVGQADAAFFASARKHVLARWRYKPATEGGRPVASSTVVTLRFELDD